ncbi:MAG: hypothetical protein IIZ91_06850, partial [Oscillospiraceae bacterium]|nr:hypothetical protein [Oscillospiraceae bacterium]
EGLLPTKNGRYYTECDIDTLGAKSRGAKRIVFSNDGLIYYTEDHYETFELLFGEAERLFEGEVQLIPESYSRKIKRYPFHTIPPRIIARRSHSDLPYNI